MADGIEREGDIGMEREEGEDIIAMKDTIEHLINIYAQLYPNIIKNVPKNIIILNDTMIVPDLSSGSLAMGMTVKPHGVGECSLCQLTKSNEGLIILPSYGVREDTILHELIHFNGIKSEFMTKRLTRLLMRMKSIRASTTDTRRYTYTITRPDQEFMDKILRMIRGLLLSTSGTNRTKSLDAYLLVRAV